MIPLLEFSSVIEMMICGHPFSHRRPTLQSYCLFLFLLPTTNTSVLLFAFVFPPTTNTSVLLFVFVFVTDDQHFSLIVCFCFCYRRPTLQSYCLLLFLLPTLLPTTNTSVLLFAFVFVLFFSSSLFFMPSASMMSSYRCTSSLFFTTLSVSCVYLKLFVLCPPTLILG